MLTSSDAILANLTPALVAEANMLRERFAHRYSRTLFGMYPRSRRGDTSRRDGIGSGLDGAGGSVTSRRSAGAKVIEADGAPLLDTEALHAMISKSAKLCGKSCQIVQQICQLCRKKWLCSASFCYHGKGSISRVLDIL